ncbi:MAG TPA: dolichyl-phosphate beta-glucosyltransferase [Anaerolineae bacterium]|nr:dolichyl-phosphate beta-glucosyltransferase [Anaerolineae bacterium]
MPAYNEEQRLPDSLAQVDRFVTAQNYPIEVIIVNNNSRDNTLKIAQDFAASYAYTRVLNEPRQGKGAAVRKGMLNGNGEYLFICDADLSMPIEQVNKFLPPVIDRYDVAIASREIKGAQRIGEPQYRHLMGRVFNLIVRVLAIPHIQDTQCGFKVFQRNAARDVFALQTIDGWGFDVEVLFIALKRKYKLIEVPITWYYKPQTKISPIRDSMKMVFEVLKVRRNGWRGQYDKQPSA